MSGMIRNIELWAVCVFAVTGAFVLCGIGGACIAHVFDWWDKPVAGFTAAFGWVSMTYLTAPAYKRIVSAVSFLVGASFAWVILEPSYLPANVSQSEYQRTHLPVIVTLIGGLVPLVICTIKLDANETNA